jgi:hypothetical protein
MLLYEVDKDTLQVDHLVSVDVVKHELEVAVILLLFLIHIFDERVFLLGVEEESKVVVWTEFYALVIKDEVCEVLVLIKLDVL